MTETRPLLSRTRDTTKKYLPEKDEETTERVPLWATHSALGVFFPLLPHPPFPQQKNKKTTAQINQDEPGFLLFPALTLTNACLIQLWALGGILFP